MALPRARAQLAGRLGPGGHDSRGGIVAGPRRAACNRDSGLFPRAWPWPPGADRDRPRPGALSTTFIDTPLSLRKVIRVTRIYDLVMTHKLDTDDYFIHCIQRFCAEARLNFFLVEPAWVDVF